VMVGVVDAATRAIGGCTCTVGGLGPRTEGLVAQPASDDARITGANPWRIRARTGDALRLCLALEVRTQAPTRFTLLSS
jgi:hypothetical protein